MVKDTHTVVKPGKQHKVRKFATKTEVPHGCTNHVNFLNTIIYFPTFGVISYGDETGENKKTDPYENQGNCEAVQTDK